jgi:hypothetical protein
MLDEAQSLSVVRDVLRATDRGGAMNAKAVQSAISQVCSPRLNHVSTLVDENSPAQHAIRNQVPQ